MSGRATEPFGQVASGLGHTRALRGGLGKGRLSLNRMLEAPDRLEHDEGLIFSWAQLS
jgi:hypothetical protein